MDNTGKYSNTCTCTSLYMYKWLFDINFVTIIFLMAQIMFVILINIILNAYFFLNFNVVKHVSCAYHMIITWSYLILLYVYSLQNDLKNNMLSKLNHLVLLVYDGVQMTHFFSPAEQRIVQKSLLMILRRGKKNFE